MGCIEDERGTFVFEEFRIFSIFQCLKRNVIDNIITFFAKYEAEEIHIYTWEWDMSTHIPGISSIKMLLKDSLGRPCDKKLHLQGAQKAFNKKCN